MNEKLKAKVEKYELRESNSKLRKECLGMKRNNDSANEKNQIIQDLQKQLDEYKKRCEHLQDQVY